MNKLLFEGAGCEGTGNDSVDNCRIRTRIRNKDGRLIYLEMGCTQYQGKHIPIWAKGLNYSGYIDACFYSDAKWDKDRNRSPELSKYEHGYYFEYNKENILDFVNNKLNCFFDDMEVVNNGLYVFDTEDALCDCSIKGYIPFKDIEININELEGIKPVSQFVRDYMAHYKIDYQYINKIPSLKNWIESRDIHEQEKFENLSYYVRIYWDKNIITGLSISSYGNFCTMSFPAEDIEMIINYIILSNKERELAHV